MLFFLIVVVLLLSVSAGITTIVNKNIEARSEYNLLVQESKKPRGPIEAPEYNGRNARDVFDEISRDYPDYRIEIVGLDYINSQTGPRFDPKRVRLYITRSSKIIKVTVG